MDVFTRQTLLDVIEDNLKTLNAKSFVSRIIFAGRHDFEPQALFDTHSAMVQKLNLDYCDVPLNGLLLSYKKHFFVISEGSESTTMRHIREFFKNEVISMKTFDLKLFAVYHNVKTRHFSTWHNLFYDPQPSLSPDELPKCGIREKLENCLAMLNNLSKYSKNIRVFKADETILLPDIALTVELLSSDSLKPLKSYLDVYLQLKNFSFSFESSWPAPHDFTPSPTSTAASRNKFIELISIVDDFNDIETQDSESNSFE